MTGDELTRALLAEDAAPRRAVAEALFASVNGGVPLLQALVDAGASTPDVLGRFLARNGAPFLRHVVAVPELVHRLPRGICARLLAVPVRRDAITGTIDVVVADPDDPHPAAEMAFHFGGPVRLVRAPVSAIEEALRRLRIDARDDAPATRFEDAANAAETGAHHLPDDLPTGLDRDETPYDSRPRGPEAPQRRRTPAAAQGGRRASLPPPEPALSDAMPLPKDLPPRRGGLVLDTDSAPPGPIVHATRTRTPPWGTPIHAAAPPEQPPLSGYGSEIPIPLTRKTFHPAMFAGGTQRPPPLVNPARIGLGEGYALDTAGLRDVVERAQPAARRESKLPEAPLVLPPLGKPLGSFIPGPPPLPQQGPYLAFAPQLPFPEMGGVLAALRNAGSRDEILELVLTGARMVAVKVALFVVKKGGYLGWVGTPELADRAALQTVLIPIEANSIFDRAVREDVYLGPVRYDEVHAPLLRVMKNPSRDVAAVPIRVSGKTAVVILADDLGDTMIGTRRLEELARAAGEAFGRILRTRR